MSKGFLLLTSFSLMSSYTAINKSHRSVVEAGDRPAGSLSPIALQLQLGYITLAWSPGAPSPGALEPWDGRIVGLIVAPAGRHVTPDVTAAP